MDDPVELQMSVTSIKRVDPYVKDILAKSTHVAVYKFNPPLNEWEKTETEGALFLYSRNGEPYHSIMIMNRLNTNNLIEPIVKEFEYQLQAPFLLFRNSKNKIFGIWFYNREECVNITLILETLMEGLKEKPVASVENKKPQENTNNVDIFSMLSRAQEDYNKTPVKSDQPRFSSTPRAPDVTSQSVMDFFAKAGVKSNKSTHTTPAPPHHVQTPDNLLQRLMSNPAHTVEHIEKQQRAVTPQGDVIHRKQQQQPNGNVDPHRKSGSISIQLHNNNNNSSDNNGFSFMTSAQSPPDGSLRTSNNTVAGSSPLANFLKQGTSLPLSQRDTSPLAHLLETPQKTHALMAPMMFASSSKDTICNAQSNVSADKDIEPLTRNQMVQAFNYLLRNDTEFVTKLHEAYVKSLTEKMVPASLI